MMIHRTESADCAGIAACICHKRDEIGTNWSKNSLDIFCAPAYNTDKGCSWGVQTALLLFPTFQKMEPGSIVRLCHAPVFDARGRQMQAAGHLPAFNSG